MLVRSLCTTLPFLLAGCGATRATTGADDFNPSAGNKVVQAFVRYIYADNSAEDDTGGGGAAQVGLDQELLTVDADLGYFVSDANELGVSVDGLWANNEFDDSSTAAVGAFYNYNVALGPRTTMYFGPEALFVRFDPGGGSERVEEVAYGGRLGFRFWFTPAVSFVVEPSYLFTPYDDEIGGDQDQFALKLGVGVKL